MTVDNAKFWDSLFNEIAERAQAQDMVVTTITKADANLTGDRNLDDGLRITYQNRTFEIFPVASEFQADLYYDGDWLTTVMSLSEQVAVDLLSDLKRRAATREEE